MGNMAVNAAGSQTRPLPQDPAFQSVFEQTIRRGGHVEADMVNATGSQARPWAQPPLPCIQTSNTASEARPWWSKHAEHKARGGGGGVIRWLMLAGPWAHLLHSRALHSNLQQGSRLLSNLL